LHLLHLHKLITTNFRLKPAYYFKFPEDYTDVSMKVLEFNQASGTIAPLDVFPHKFLTDRQENWKNTFLTNSKFRLFLKRVKIYRNNVLKNIEMKLSSP
jgi:hypothetical protein